MIGTASRYYLLKSYAAKAKTDLELASVWLAKHATAAGTPLPVTFPSLVALTAAAYLRKEDVVGATADELIANANLTRPQATAVVAAAALL